MSWAPVHFPWGEPWEVGEEEEEGEGEGRHLLEEGIVEVGEEGEVEEGVGAELLTCLRGGSC